MKDFLENMEDATQDAKNEECIRCKYYLADVDLYKPKRRPILAFLLSRKMIKMHQEIFCPSSSLET